MAVPRQVKIPRDIFLSAFSLFSIFWGYVFRLSYLIIILELFVVKTFFFPKISRCIISKIYVIFVLFQRKELQFPSAPACMCKRFFSRLVFEDIAETTSSHTNMESRLN